MPEPLVSVLICTIRNEPRLSLTLDCLAHQTYQNFELVYIDALKDKRSESFIVELENFGVFHKVKHIKDSPITGALKPRLSAARNLGLLYCKGDVICIIGDNQFFQKTWIERHVKLVEQQYISVSPCYNIDKSSTFEDLKDATIEHHEKPDRIFVKTKNEIYDAPRDCRVINLPDKYLFGDDILQASPGWLHGVSVAVSLDRLLNINSFDENFDKGYGWEDNNLGLRLSRMGFKMALDPKNWVISVNDKSNPTLVKMFGVSGETNEKLWNATVNGETGVWANENFNLRKMREKLRYFEQ